MKKLSVLLLASMVSISVHAKLYVPESEQDFYKYIKRHSLVVVHTNPYRVEQESSKMGTMKESFLQLSKSDRYRDADIGFVGVNLQAIPDLADDFKVTLPQFVAAEDTGSAEIQDIADTSIADSAVAAAAISDSKDDKDAILAADEKLNKLLREATLIVAYKDGVEVARHAGYMSESAMENFIEKQFARDIDATIQKNKRLEQERAQKRAEQQQQTQTRVYYPAQQTRTYVADDYYDYYYPSSYSYYPRRRFWGGYSYPRYRHGWGGWGGYGPSWGWGGRRGWGRGGIGFGIGFGW